MATLNTTNIKHGSSSSNNIVLASDGKVTFPQNTGNILQVVQTVKKDSFSSTSSSFVDITGMSVTITPSSSSSKILVRFHLGCFNNGNNSSRAFVSILRGSTKIFDGDADTGHECTIAVCTRSNDDNHIQIPVSGEFLDSPATTSATTYKLQGSVGTDGGTMTLNRPNAPDAQSGNAASTITVMEVAA
tara:strand:- start:519 stop:1082 length:564 start_codon:yes stop_codon:yes gene_type:complete